jgi:hypothetical protein
LIALVEPEPLPLHAPDPSTVKLSPRRLSPSDKETTRVLPRFMREALDDAGRCAAVVMEVEEQMQVTRHPLRLRRLERVHAEAMIQYERALAHVTAMKRRDPGQQLNRNWKLVTYAVKGNY